MQDQDILPPESQASSLFENTNMTPPLNWNGGNCDPIHTEPFHNGPAPGTGEQIGDGVPHPRRHLSTLLFILLFLLGVLLIPTLAEKIAFALQRGAERAKAEVARELLATLNAPEERVPWVAKKVAPSVVGIRISSPEGFDPLKTDIGSGVIVDPAGYILTNNHVVAEAQRRLLVRLNGGSVVQNVTVVGRDAVTDLAVLKIDSPRLEAVSWGDSKAIEVGAPVLAIGSPYGFGQTVTTGIISAKERVNRVPGDSRGQEFLQTDAAINPGNSGGPLVDMSGNLIGINTMIFSESGSNAGIGFAIPSVLAKKVYEQIRKTGVMRHGWIGIGYIPTLPDYAKLNKMERPQGVVVTEIWPDSPAERAGLRIGDVILRWNDAEIKNSFEMSHVIVQSEPGQTAQAHIIRRSKPLEIEVTLGVRPTDLE